jgi:hypothetical protein
MWLVQVAFDLRGLQHLYRGSMGLSLRCPQPPQICHRSACPLGFARESLENVHIIQGATLYREVGQNFLRCAIKRKKYLEAAFGPIRVSWPLHHLSTVHRWTF